MAKLAIKGHSTRGKEVIEILEMLGGKNIHNYNGTFNECYVIDNNKICTTYTSVSKIDGFVILTLEEFLEKFPYKIGDKVHNIIHNENQTITDSVWVEDEVLYQTNNNEYVYVNYLQPYKKETVEKEISGAIIDRFICLEGYDFYDDKGNIIDTKEIIMKKKQPKYPKTFVECAKILDCFCASHIDGYKCELLENLQELLICRDAYWKIAGEQIGLGKPFEPDWLNVEQDKYVLFTHNNAICSNRYVLGHNILAFPTEEMRDAFYENFKELIESCKELL